MWIREENIPPAESFGNQVNETQENVSLRSGHSALTAQWKRKQWRNNWSSTQHPRWLATSRRYSTSNNSDQTSSRFSQSIRWDRITCGVVGEPFVSLSESSCRYRLSSLNEKLTALERHVDYLEARVNPFLFAALIDRSFSLGQQRRNTQLITIFFSLVRFLPWIVHRNKKQSFARFTSTCRFSSPKINDTIQFDHV